MVDLRPVVRGAGELLGVSCGTVPRLGCGTTAPVLRNAAHRRSSLAAGDRRVDHHFALFVCALLASAAFVRASCKIISAGVDKLRQSARKYY